MAMLIFRFNVAYRFLFFFLSVFQIAQQIEYERMHGNQINASNCFSTQ